MNRKIQAALLIALLVALLPAYYVWHTLNATVDASHQAKTRLIVAANANIKVGTVLSASDLTTIEVAGTLPDGAIVDPKVAVGRGVAAELFKGEPILDSRLATGAGLVVEIPIGMRAIAIRVDDIVGVSGFATPGMFVDVLISGIPPNPGTSAAPSDTVVKTLLQNLKVISAGPDIQKDAEGKAKSAQVVNLLVTPEQAQILSLANSNSHIQLVLRNPLDTQNAEVNVNNLTNIYKDPNAKPAAPVAVHKSVKRQAAPDFTVEDLSGSGSTIEKFNAPEGKQ
jgi:pilus assembly protein CpaB